MAPLWPPTVTTLMIGGHIVSLDNDNVVNILQVWYLSWVQRSCDLPVVYWLARRLCHLLLHRIKGQVKKGALVGLYNWEWRLPTVVGLNGHKINILAFLATWKATVGWVLNTRRWRRTALSHCCNESLNNLFDQQIETFFFITIPP